MRQAARRSKEQASWPHPRAARRPGWKEAVSIKVTEESVSAGGRGEGGQLRPRRACGWSGPGHSSGTRACAEGGTGFRSQQQRRGHMHWTPVLTTPSAEGERTAGHPRTERGREGAGEDGGGGRTDRKRPRPAALCGSASFAHAGSLSSTARAQRTSRRRKKTKNGEPAREPRLPGRAAPAGHVLTLPLACPLSDFAGGAGNATLSLERWKL